MDKLEFKKSIYNLRDIPKDNLSEAIICGRSNVGKSSFINTLFNRKGIAKTSSTPGKTRSINYYLVDESFYMVDLPGYGFAKVQLKEQLFWEKLLSEYISTNLKIKMAFHLIDSRHKPTKLDILLQDFLYKAQVPNIIILNKVDKLNSSELFVLKRNVTNIFPNHTLNENLFLFSAHSKYGCKEIKSALFNWIKKE